MQRKKRKQGRRRERERAWGRSWPAHHAARHRGVERDAPARQQRAGGQRNAHEVVEQRPAQVLADLAQRGAAQAQRLLDLAQRAQRSAARGAGRAGRGEGARAWTEQGESCGAAHRRRTILPAPAVCVCFPASRTRGQHPRPAPMPHTKTRSHSQKKYLAFSTRALPAPAGRPAAPVRPPRQRRQCRLPWQCPRQPLPAQGRRSRHPPPAAGQRQARRKRGGLEYESTPAFSRAGEAGARPSRLKLAAVWPQAPLAAARAPVQASGAWEGKRSPPQVA